MFKRIFVGIVGLLLAGVVLAQAYRWVDADGVVQYSDRPVPGAERIELPSSGNAPRRPRATTPAPRRTTAAAPQTAPDQEPIRYESLAVASPAAEETLWNIGGVLNVSLNLQPALQPGHQIRVYFDGESRTTVRSTSLQIEEVWRGAHNIQAEVLDEAGNLMIRSMPNRFYVQQTRVN